MAESTQPADWDQPDPGWLPEALGPKFTGAEKQPPEEFFGAGRVQELSNVSVPDDLRQIMSAPESLIEVDRHVLEEVVSGGKHDQVRWHAEHLQEVIDHWSLWGHSPSAKIQEDAARWEVYTRLNHEYWLLMILGTKGIDHIYRVVTMYPAKTQTVKNRAEGNEYLGIAPYLKRRRRG